MEVKMKKIAGVLFLILGIALLSGCASFNVPVEQAKQAILGPWLVGEIDVQAPNGSWVKLDIGVEIYIFANNGSGMFYSGGKSNNFQWAMGSGGFEIKHSSGYYEKFTDVQFQQDYVQLKGKYDILSDGVKRNVVMYLVKAKEVPQGEEEGGK